MHAGEQRGRGVLLLGVLRLPNLKWAEEGDEEGDGIGISLRAEVDSLGDVSKTIVKKSFFEVIG